MKIVTTSNDIIKELNKLFYKDNKQYFEFIGNKRFVQNNTFNQGICIENNIFMNDFNLPLELEDRIKKFLIQKRKELEETQ